jgi:hypothetical protein
MHLLLIAFAGSLGTIERILDSSTKRFRGGGAPGEV